MKLRWTDGALEDLQAAREYLEAENPRAAWDAINRIISAVERLERFPQMGRPGRVDRSRELVVTGTPFVLAYRLKGESIQVLAVLHGARKWPKSF
ncbi:MAG: type II toxin-antitoxin system RelE/ParE family toxin [Candidatus Sulfotelmatobacter sp.]